MAKGKSAPTPVKSSGGERPNGKKWKKNPGPAQPEKTNFTHVNGRTANSNAKREAWKAKGGRYMHESIPHWKTGLVWDKENKVFRLPGKVNA
ncbi:hypothetical protein UFOVP27_11 [uncultured Caudovirales phage]|uniref:Uncharacterized protein n=1 Tax=uncultured Caudovirales phage TaxID=2100421 RepID=A0A6J5KK13_9CAUD|nr:hypothetical protein UFOVP27_11 [uncultured Caudovirales phage]